MQSILTVTLVSTETLRVVLEQMVQSIGTACRMQRKETYVVALLHGLFQFFESTS